MIMSGLSLQVGTQYVWVVTVNCKHPVMHNYLELLAFNLILIRFAIYSLTGPQQTWGTNSIQ